MPRNDLQTTRDDVELLRAVDELIDRKLTEEGLGELNIVPDVREKVGVRTHRSGLQQPCRELLGGETPD